MNLKPLGDRVIIKVMEKEEKTAAGIVGAVGPGKIQDDGSRVNMEVKVGDKVVYSKYAGTEIKIDGEEYLILRQDDILGVFS